MSKLATLFLAAAAAQVSNEDRASDDVVPVTGTRPADDTAAEDGFVPSNDDDDLVAANPDDDESAQALIAAQTDAREERESVESLKASLEGLVRFHRFLGHLNATGGVSRQALAFTQIGLEAYTEGLEQPSIGLGVSFESFADSGERQELSLEHLEHFISQLKDIMPMAEQNVVSAEQRVLETSRTFHPSLRASFESVMTGAESDCDDGRALAAAQDLDSQAQLNQVSDVASAALDGMERVREEVVVQNADGGLSQEALVAASLALEAFTSPLGLPEIELAADLTPFADGARAQVSVEAIDLGMEGAMDALKNAGAAIAAKARKTVATVKNALNMLNGMLPKTIEALEAFIADLDKNKVQTKGTVSAKGLSKKLHDGGKVPANMAQYLIGFAGFAERFMGPFTTAAQTGFAANSRAMAKLDFNSLPGFRASLGTLAGEWKDPRSALSAADLSATIPGEGRVFVDQEAPKYNGDVKELQHFIDLQTKNVLHGTWFRPERRLSDSSTALPAMSYEDIKKVATALLKLLKGIKTKDLEVHGDVINDYWNADSLLTGFQMESRGMRGRLRKEIRIISQAYAQTTVKPALEFGWDMARSSVRVARTFMAYAKASLATANAVSTESVDDDVSLEAFPFLDKVKRLEKKVAKLDADLKATDEMLADSKRVLAEVKADAAKGDAAKFAKKIQKIQDEIVDLETDRKDIQSVQASVKADLAKAKAAKPSSEGLEVSLEGADIKDLKAGKPVKFSHGHGKIEKVYTAPFMYDRKSHTASKDSPKYLVKDSKGKHSIHKASALTIA